MPDNFINLLQGLNKIYSRFDSNKLGTDYVALITAHIISGNLLERQFSPRDWVVYYDRKLFKVVFCNKTIVWLIKST